MAYSDEHRFIVTASFDHDVLVWSPFSEKLVFRLAGHQAPLVGVQFVTGAPQLVPLT
jgi:hypothetical protein